MELAELSKAFSIKQIHSGYAHFDPAQLNFWQKKAIRQQKKDTFWNLLDSAFTNKVPYEARACFIEVMQAMVVFPSQAHDWINCLFTTPFEYNEASTLAIRQAGTIFWSQLLDVFKGSQTVDQDALLGQLKLFLNRAEDKIQRQVRWQALRAALTNRPSGPDMLSLIKLLGIPEMSRRLHMAADLAHASLETC
jgi:glutamyl/glutaminyl-tRNA synthetase